MVKTVVPFRTLKHSDPIKFKVLVEDLEPGKRIALRFTALVAIASAVAFAVGYLAF